MMSNRIRFGFLFFPALAMTILPWVWLAIVWVSGGIPMEHSRVAEQHEQELSFFVTNIAVVVGALIAYLFREAIKSLAEIGKPPGDGRSKIIRIVFSIALCTRSFSRYLFKEREFILCTIPICYAIAFAFVVPGITALLFPIHFSRTVSLAGTELDFTSNNTDCISWLNNNDVTSTCNWETLHGFRYMGCLNQNEMLDVLKAGHSNMVSTLSNESTSAIYPPSQLVEFGGLRLLGSSHGVLPNGPDGIPAFNTLTASVFSEIIKEPAPSYNYTLELQGVSSNVTCKYDAETNITYTTIAPNVWQFLGACPPGQDFLTYPYQVSPSNYTLGFWACETSADTYILYLRGTNQFATNIGNLTCIVSSFVPAVFPLTYTQQRNFFVAQEPISLSPGTSTDLLRNAVKGLGDIIWKAQGPVTNWVGDTVFSFGTQLFDLQPDTQNEEYLRLYETMIKGVLDYQATTLRLIYSAKMNGTIPQSCTRSINGSGEFQVFGWHVESKTTGFLVPVTVINLTSTIILIIALCHDDREGDRNYFNHEGFVVEYLMGILPNLSPPRHDNGPSTSTAATPVFGNGVSGTSNVHSGGYVAVDMNDSTFSEPGAKSNDEEGSGNTGGSEGPKGSDEGTVEEGEEGEEKGGLRRDKQPPLRPGVMPRMALPAIDSGVEMVDNDVVHGGGLGTSGGEDEDEG